MNFTQFAFLGGIAAALAAGWNYVRMAWAKIASLVVVTIHVEDQLAEAFILYLYRTGKSIRVGPPRYMGAQVRVRTSWRPMLVAWEVSSRLGSFYWYGNKPIWMQWEGKHNDDETVIWPERISISFLRGSYNPDDLITTAVTFFNNAMVTSSGHERRHLIKRIYGRSNKNAQRGMGMGDDGDVMGPSYSSPHSPHSQISDFKAARPVSASAEDLGTQAGANGIEYLALTDDVQVAVEEIRRWRVSEHWYRQRGLPWRRGWLLYGPAGTGKTSLTRGISEELDLPLYIYDLASLANDELQRAWTDMLTHTPCAALIEDFDSVFEKRKTLAGQLTFDALLNCISGVEQADGLFLVITTNKLESIDDAIGIPVEGHTSSRPGRISRIIHMDTLDVAGRTKLCKRILSDWPQTWERIVTEGEKDTGDQFQERCFLVADRIDRGLPPFAS